MTGFIGLTKRNLLLYFKDIPAVIFSLLTSIIVFVLYLIFLKGTFVDSIESSMTGLEAFIKSEDVNTLVSAILLVGILGSALITVPYSCLSIVVKDKENKIDYDILATPIRRWQIIFSYFVSAVISAFIVTSLILTIGLVILGSKGDMNMSVFDIAETYGIILLGSVSSTAIFLIISMFFKSSSASSAFFGMLSAASGFVIGAYIPLSQFSENVQTICNIFPATQITVLLRNNLLSGILSKINDGIGGVDNGAFVNSIKASFNFKSAIMGNEFSKPGMYIYVIVALLVSLVVMVVAYSKTYKRK